MENSTSTARPAQARETIIYRWVVGFWMSCAILFGVLNLMGILNIR